MAAEGGGARGDRRLHAAWRGGPRGVCRRWPARLSVADLQQLARDHKQGCCSASDAEDARRVADRLDIPFYALEPAGRIPADHRLLHRRIHPRPHAQPVRAVQQLAEVRQAVRLCRQRRRRVRRHGALCRDGGSPNASERWAQRHPTYCRGIDDARTSRTCCSASSGGCSRG